MLDGLGEKIESEGELNYAITRLGLILLRKLGKNYANINGIVGVIECAKLEFYRRIAAPYEDDKRKENGDIEI
jgi:hypothetical protein